MSGRGTGGAACRDCRWFAGGAQRLERALPLLRAMSSAHASVRGGDGLCLQHDRHVLPGGACPRHAAA